MCNAIAGKIQDNETADVADDSYSQWQVSHEYKGTLSGH